MHMKLRLVRFCFHLRPALCLLLCCALYAATIQQVHARRALYFEYLTVEDGLVQNTVHGIAMDKQGFMWFGTWNGLCRYDGYKFRVYRADPSDSTSLVSNRIHLIYKDTSGTLWISAFDSIVCRYNYETDNFTRFRLSDLPREVRDSTNRRLAVSPRRAEDGMTRWEVRNNALWQTDLVTGEGFPYASGVFDRQSPNDDYVYSLFKDNRDILWIGTSRGGVNKADLRAKPFRNQYCLVQDGNHRVNIPVKALTVVGDELWLGSNSNGISVVHLPTGTQRNYLRAGTGSRQPVSPNVRCMFADSRGHLWIGYRSGLDRYDPATGLFRHYSGPGDFGLNLGPSIYAIEEDQHKNLWIGGYGGVYRYVRENDQFQYYDLTGFIGNTSIMCLLATRNGQLWVGSETGGVLQVFLSNDGTRWDHIEHFASSRDSSVSIPDNRIYALEEDSDGHVWIGTSNGVCRMNLRDGSMQTFTAADGLADVYISRILSDQMGGVWISHKKGLTRVNTTTGVVKNYSVREGFQGYEFLDGSGFRDPVSGILYFGGVEGYVAFRPDQILDNPYPPVVVFTDLQILNKTVSPGQEVNGRILLSRPVTLTQRIDLTYQDRGFSIEFAGLHYSCPEKNMYAYMLEGYDEDWIHTDATRRTAVYSHLPPGTYTFKVLSANSDGVWSPEPAVLTVVMHPPWWATPWAYMAYALLILGIALGVYRLIVAREQYKHQILMEKLKAEKIAEFDRIKSRFFTNISHEFRTPLSLIIDPLRKLLTGNASGPQAREYLQLMHRNAERLLGLINQLLDFRKVESGQMTLNPEQRDMVAFIRHVISSFDFLAEQKSIHLEFLPPKDRFVMGFDPDKLDKILINLISNAFKFTPSGGSISVQLELPPERSGSSSGALIETAPDEVVSGASVGGDPLPGKPGRADADTDSIRIRVCDSGSGISPESIDKIFDPFYQSRESESGQGGTGLGLALTRELVVLHGGSISVESEKPRGTTFTITLPCTPGEVSSSELPDVLPAPEVSEAPAGMQESALPLVLVVEDNEDMRRYLCADLREEYAVLEATNGQEAYEQALETIPDLVLSDVMMPGWDGLTLCRKLKTDERTSHIPVILLTARHSDEVRMEGYETGADDYLTKPFNAAVLRSRISNLIESRQRLRALFRQGSDFELKKISVNLLDEQFLKKAVRIVEEHLSSSGFGPDDLAAGLKISRAQLFRKIKALTNQTVLDFITTIRLNRAVELLQSGDYSVSEVAWQTGFSEHSNFTRSFVKQFGQTPSGFLKGPGKAR